MEPICNRVSSKQDYPNFEQNKITSTKFIARRKESCAEIKIGSNHQNYESRQRQLYSDYGQKGL